MPAILSTPEDIKLWLSDKPFNQVVHLLKPYKEMLTCYKVPLEVGSVRNNSPEFIRVSISLFHFSREKKTYPRRAWKFYLFILFYLIFLYSPYQKEKET